MSKRKDQQRLIHLYRRETGINEIDMQKLAKWAVEKGYQNLPKPADPIDLLAREFSKSARQETKIDEKSGRPYRVNHNFTVNQGGNKQSRLWVDIDDANYSQMHKSMTNRREQMIGDAAQLSNDVDHWNSINQNSQQLELDLDLTDDVKWRRLAEEDEEDVT